MTPTIAVLAVQGAFVEHAQRLSQLGCRTLELRQAADLAQPFDALVLPGGESTVQSKLLHELGMFTPLHARIADGLPTLGTCAGLILLAQHIEGEGDTTGLDTQLAAQRTQVEGFATLPITVQRNGYGRQLGSFHAHAAYMANAAKPGAEGEAEPDAQAIADVACPIIPMTFIRAPRITHTGEGVRVLARFDNQPVAVRAGNQLACAFHPELDADDAIYRAFLDMIG